jgi:hypothetical protein
LLFVAFAHAQATSNNSKDESERKMGSELKAERNEGVSEDPKRSFIRF